MATTLEVVNAAQLAFINNVPTAMLTQTAAQSIPGPNVDTAISWNSALYDAWGGWSAGSPTRYTCKVAGIYSINASIYWSSGTTATRRLCYVKLNNTTNIHGSIGEVITASASYSVNNPTNPVLQSLNVGDYVELIGNQDTAGALNTNAGATGASSSSMTIQWVRNQ